MRVLIIEDELQAATRMQRLVKEIKPDAAIVATLDTVKKSVAWFQVNEAPDLTLMDIQLADGISFQIFEKCHVACPVIFTTAYDEYALRAFKVNSIDYILKPIDKDELAAAFEKLKNVSRNSNALHSTILADKFDRAMLMLKKKFKTRFVIKVREHLRTIEVVDILYFFSQEKTTFCHTIEKRDFILDFTLDHVEEMLDPSSFFRVNRKHIVTTKAIDDIINHSNSRLRLVLKDSSDTDIIVARERVQEFKQWLDQ